MLMIASSKDSQFLSVWVCNCFFFFSLGSCFPFSVRPILCRSIVFGLVLGRLSPNKLICLFVVKWKQNITSM